MKCATVNYYYIAFNRLFSRSADSGEEKSDRRFFKIHPTFKPLSIEFVSLSSKMVNVSIRTARVEEREGGKDFYSALLIHRESEKRK